MQQNPEAGVNSNKKESKKKIFKAIRDPEFVMKLMRSKFDEVKHIKNVLANEDRVAWRTF